MHTAGRLLQILNNAYIYPALNDQLSNQAQVKRPVQISAQS